MSRAVFLSRRRLLHIAGGAAVGASAWPLHAIAAERPAADTLELVNLHTGESATVILTGPEPDATSLLRLQHVLRDHRSGDEHAIDTALFTQLRDLAAAAGVDARYEIISGYRSPATNAQLHERSTGVASRSLHLEGRALDVRLKRVDCLKLAELARGQQRGGVGYYARSAFVHIDTGRVRTWEG